MNQEKIGKFILELRKEKGLTQQELANLLGVTDRAISKWENGRGMPDLSLMDALCKELGITINELLSGERVDKKNYQKKLEENILNTILYTDKKIKKNHNTFKIVTLIILIIISLFITMYFIDIRRMSQNRPVIFSTWGFSYTPPVQLNEDEIEMAIRYYLVEEGDSETKHYVGEKTFVSMKVYLIEELKRDEKFNVYAWVRTGKYYLDKNELKEGSGSSIPYKFIVEKINNEYKVTEYKIPRDGSYYSNDMKKIFPSNVRRDMNKVHTDGTVEKLGKYIEEQAKLYFRK